MLISVAARVFGSGSTDLGGGGHHGDGLVTKGTPGHCSGAEKASKGSSPDSACLSQVNSSPSRHHVTERSEIPRPESSH